MRLSIGIALLLATIGYADVITMRSGRVINGNYVGGTARSIKVEVGGHVETLDLSDVDRIEFTGGPSSPAPADDDRRPTLRRSPSSEGDVILHPDPNQAAAAAAAQSPTAAPPRDPVELPSGTTFSIRLIDGVDSDVNRVGNTFRASLDEDVKGPDGQVLIPKGSDATVKLVDAKDSGKFTGRAELTLSLMSVKVDGRPVEINTQTISKESSSRGERTAKVAGGGAALGAIIGAIAGGGKGAAVGAAAGGAAGAGAEVVTKGQRVKIPSETRLTFVLDSPVRV